MGHLRSEIGFVGSIRRSTVGQLLWPEGTIALLLGLVGGSYLLSVLTVAERKGVVGDLLALTAALVGVVFAAFALPVALFSDTYVRLLSQAEGGVIAFFRPFMIAIGVLVTTILLAISYRAVATEVPSKVEVGAFLAVAVLGVYSLVDVIALARTVTMHGCCSAARGRGGNGAANVRKIPERGSASGAGQGTRARDEH